MDFRKTRFKKIKTEYAAKRIDVAKLKDHANKQKIGKIIAEKFEETNATILDNIQLQAEWSNVEGTLTEIQEEHVGYRGNEGRKPWMTQEILDLMEDRRKLKSVNDQGYRETNKVIRRKIREAKEKWLSEKCEEIEDLERKHDSFNVHKKVKELAGTQRKWQASFIRSSDGKIIIGIEEKLNRWKEYIETIFKSADRGSQETEDEIEDIGPEIIKGEVIQAIKRQKNGKATGPDKIHAELLKLIAEQDGKALQILTSLLNKVHQTGHIPHSWLKSTFIAIPKKTGAADCDDYRMISLMSHVLKVLLRIIHARIAEKCENQVDEMQFGFRSSMGTREAIFAVRVLTQRCRDMNQDVYACFIDYRKAFDTVDHGKMMQTLKNTGVDYGVIRIIRNLYWGQEASIKLGNTESQAVKIEKGVRQGCVLSPLLFNIYSNNIFRESSECTEGGIVLNGKSISNIRYADDTVILAKTEEELQRMLDYLVEKSTEYGNIRKTKVLGFTKVST